MLAQGPDIVPIPGTKRLAFLAENNAAATLPLSEPEMAALNALEAVPVAGDRYTDEGMKGVDA